LGKQEFSKDLTAILIAHHIPYVAQASPHDFRDLMEKVRKATTIEGPAFLNILAPCHRGWRYKMEDSIEMARLAVETCFWPLFEVENGVWKLNYQPKEKQPLIKWVEQQGRFRHIMAEPNKHILEELQADVDKRWEEIKQKAGV